MQREFITFEVSGQLFALDIMAIREIRAWTPATRVPHVPRHVAGVVNLRGTVLPVIDLAVRLGWESTEATPRHAIIVTQLDAQASGLIVESVSDIVTIPADSLQNPPASAADTIAPFIEGLAAIDDRMAIVLDLAALGRDELVAEAA
ncbi:MAG: chemotaxis protein CheW [Novosphingobium sp.]